MISRRQILKVSRGTIEVRYIADQLTVLFLLQEVLT